MQPQVLYRMAQEKMAAELRSSGSQARLREVDIPSSPRRRLRTIAGHWLMQLGTRLAGQVAEPTPTVPNRMRMT